MEQKTKNILKISIGIIVLLIILGSSIVYMHHAFFKQNQLIQKRVESIVSTDFNIHSAKPFFLIPHKIDSTGNYVLTQSEIDSIENYISKYYLKSYHAYYDSVIACKEFSPFLITPNKKDKSGNIILSPKDAENIQSYINYLTKQVNSAIEQSKIEIDNDIDRLNIWVTIWVAVMALVGMVFPYLINKESFNEAKEEARAVREKADNLETDISQAKTDSNIAKELAQNTKDEIKSQKEQLEKLYNKLQEKTDKISEIEKRFGDIEKNLSEKDKVVSELEQKLSQKDTEIEELLNQVDNVKTDAEEAKDNSSKALELTKKQNIVIKHLTVINKLKRLDFYRLAYAGSFDLDEYYASSFSEVRDVLKKYKLDGDVDFKSIFQGLLKDYAIAFQETINHIDPRVSLNNIKDINSHIGTYLETGDYSEIETVIALLDKIVEDLNN
jgi:hypothetical protein